MIVDLGQQYQMGHRTGEDEHTVHGQREQKEVKVSVIAFAHAVSHPRAMVIESFDAIVTNRTVRRTWRPKDLAGEAVLELDASVLHRDFFCPRWRPVGRAIGPVRAVGGLNLPLDVQGLRFGGSAIKLGFLN